MSPILPAVMWIDPGDMTGFAVVWNHGMAFWCDELPFNDACDSIGALTSKWGRQAAVGWEDYRIDPRRPQTDAYDAIGIIGFARWATWKARSVVLPPAEPRTPTPDDRHRLQAIGWWRPAKNDAQSAASHMLRYLQRTGQLPPRERDKLHDAVRTL